MTLLLDKTFDAETVGSAPSGWAEVAGYTGLNKYTVQNAPAGMSGRSLKGVERVGADSYFASPTFTRQTSGTLYIGWWQKVGTVASGKQWAYVRAQDGSSFIAGTYIDNTTVVGWYGSGGASTVNLKTNVASNDVLYICMAIDLTAKKVKWWVNGTLYDNSGSWYSTLGTGTPAVDRLWLDTYTPNSHTGDNYLDNFKASTTAPISTAPSSGTLYGSGTHSGVVCGPTIYGSSVLVCSGGSVNIVERSADGGTTWADITANCQITDLGGGDWKVVDTRPTLGSQAATFGSAVKYRTTSSGGEAFILDGSAPSPTTAVSVTPNIDQDAVIHAQLEAGRAYRNGLGTNYVPTSSMLQPGQWLMHDAYGFWKYTAMGWSNASDHLTHCSNQWTYIKGLAQSSGPASGLLCLDGNTAAVETDAHFRPILHALECARLLRATGDGTAVTLAADMISYCQTWAKNGIDKLPRASQTYGGWNANSQTAWQASHAYSVGDLVRPVSTNGRSYRCQTAGTSGGSAPTWPTSAGGTVTDGSVVWKETTRTATHFAHIYTVSGSISSSSTSYLMNKELAVAAALAMLMAESTATDFFTGGSYRSTAQAIIDGNIDTALSCFTNSDGSMPYSDGTGMASGLTQNDTLYGAFCTSTVATIQKIGLTSDWQVAPFLSKSLDFLETGNYSTEPLACIHRTGLGSGMSPGGDIAFRFAAYTILSRSNPTRNLIYQTCFNDPATGYPTDYTQYGGGTAYSGAALEDIFDGLTLEAAVTTATTDLATRGSATATGRAAADKITDTATRGSASFTGRSAAAAGSTNDPANRGSASFAGRSAPDKITDSTTRGSAAFAGRAAAETLGGVTDTATRGAFTANGRGAVDRTPGAALRRPFFAPLDLASVTAPLDVVAVTAPLDMDVEA